MKKHNLSAIMKRAWEIKKANKDNIFSLCLKMAWEESRKEEITMTGTEKQITWAESIKADCLNTIERNIVRLTNMAAEYETMKSRCETEIKAWNIVKGQITDAFAQITDASKIINNRSTFSAQFITQQVDIQVRKLNKK